jgi:hypothetical protein
LLGTKINIKQLKFLSIMTTLEQIKFASKLQKGTKVKGYGGQIMIITGTNKYGFTAYSEYAFKKYGKKTKCLLPYERIQNPHYNKNLEILE